MSLSQVQSANPATCLVYSAEVIGLSLRRPGMNGYIDIQILTAVLFLASFFSSTCVSREIPGHRVPSFLPVI